MAKSKQQIAEAADKARRAKVDEKNKQAAEDVRADMDKLANTPLNPEQLAFCQDVASKMNKGRRDEGPCPADILRYSKLKGRMDIKAKVEE